MDENGIPKQEKESPRYSKSRSPVFIFNVIYTILELNKRYEILIDLIKLTANLVL